MFNWFILILILKFWCYQPYDLRNHSLQTRSKTERLEPKLLYSVKQTIKGFQWIAPFNNNPIHRDSHDRTNRTNNQRQKYWISKRWFSAGFIDKRDRETVWQDEDDIWPFYHFDFSGGWFGTIELTIQFECDDSTMMIPLQYCI